MKVISSSVPPARCPFCGDAAVTATARILRGAVARHWLCVQCDREWPAEPHEESP